MCAAILSDVDSEILKVLSYRELDPYLLEAEPALRLLHTISAVHEKVFDRQQRAQAYVNTD